MNERDKELAKQAWTENDWEGHVDLGKFADLIRADEREACAKLCENSVEYAGDELARQIRARGNK
jgi:hypothetical protein